MSDLRKSFVSQGVEDGGRREMMLQRMTLITWTRESSAIIDVFSL